MASLHLFLEMMATERGATRSTLSAYDADLRNFDEFLKDQPLEKVTFQNIQSYLLTQKHLSPSTIERRLSSLRQFYTFLCSLGTIKENPLSLVKATHHKPKASSLLGTRNVERLLEGAKTWDGMEGKRLSALLQLFWVTDLSVQDIVSLPLTVTLSPLAKTGDNEGLEIHCNNALAPEALQEYLKIRNSFLVPEKESPWLFPSSSQKGHLTRQRFGQLLKELALKVGIDSEHISIATIRREFRNFNYL